MSPVMNQPSAANACCGERRVGVADEALGAAAPDLARLAGADVASVLVDDAQLDTGQRRAVGVQALLARRVRRAAGDRRVLGRPEAARRHDAELLGAFADRGGHRRTAEPDRRHQRPVPLDVEVGMVEQADEEVRRALTRRQAVFEHRREHAAGIPDVDEVHGLAAVHRQQQRREHPDPVADRRADQRRRPAGLDRTELADLGADGAMGVHHPLRVRRRARRVRDERRARSGSTAAGVGDRFVGDEVGEAQVRAGISPTTAAHSRSGRSVRIASRLATKSRWPKRVGGDQRLHPGAPQDVRHLLRSVEVHDRARRSRRGTRSRRRWPPPRPSSAAGTRPHHRG